MQKSTLLPVAAGFLSRTKVGRPKDDVIDLTLTVAQQISREGTELRQVARTNQKFPFNSFSENSGKRSEVNVVDLTQPAATAEAADDGEHQLERLFRVQTTIVGKRHYNGHMNDGEMIYLVREPRNPYDCNAIRVDSINQQQVGHIIAKNGHARVLSRISDRRLEGGAGAVLEGMVVSGSKNVYVANAELHIVGLTQHHHLIAAQLDSGRLPYQDLATGERKWGFNLKDRQSNSQSPVNHHRLTEEEIIENLNGIWDKLDSDSAELSIDINNYHGLHAENFLTNLFPHQRKGVAWMLRRESEADLPPLYSKVCRSGVTKYHHSLTEHDYEFMPPPIRGGALCDDMGLGKSIMTLALMLANPPVRLSERLKARAMTSPSTAGEQRSLEELDGSEEKPLERRTAAELKTLARKAGLKLSGCKADLIARIGAHQQECSKSLARKSAAGCGDATDNSHPTLIVCPLSVLSSWQEQLDIHVAPGVLTAEVYHGAARAQDASQLEDVDVVLTTYDVLASEYIPPERTKTVDEEPSTGKKRKLEQTSPLLRIKWFRVVLDEAHIIRNTKTVRSMAVCALQSRYRWCLTGTPVQNAAQDLHALMQFLQVEPFKSDPSLFARYLGRPIKSGDPVALAHLQNVMKAIALKRNKKQLLSNDELPPKTEVIVSVSLSKEEREAYDAIHFAVEDYLLRVEQKTGNSSVAANYNSILAYITRMRQCCLDLSLVPAEALVKLLESCRQRSANATGGGKGGSPITIQLLTKEEKEGMLNKFRNLFAAATGSAAHSQGWQHDEVDIECSVCFDSMSEDTAVIFRICTHTFCQRCVDNMFRMNSNSNSRVIHCPLCRETIKSGDYINYQDLMNSVAKVETKEFQKVADAIFDDKAPISSLLERQPTDASDVNSRSANSGAIRRRSSKSTEVIKALHAIRAQDLGEKTVIFSNFTKYLDILQEELKNEEGLQNCCRIDGSTPQKDRAAEIRRFTNDITVPIMLCSVKAAGVGITLTAANHVFLVDLWWAPAVDLQAIDRVHRIGQTRPVRVLRFIVSESIDEKIFRLQLRKNELAREAFERKEEDGRNRISDVQMLLSR